MPLRWRPPRLLLRLLIFFAPKVSQLLPGEGRCESSVFFFSLWFVAFEPSRLCRHPSIRTLLLSDFRSVQVRCPYFSRCCHLIPGDKLCLAACNFKQLQVPRFEVMPDLRASVP
jgi:hypothetical protein